MQSYLLLKLEVSKKSLPLQPLQPNCAQVRVDQDRLRLGPDHSQSLTDSNFAAL